MGFLAPAFLLGLLAVAIPLAIHLIRRENPPKVIFSTLRFFQQTTRKQFLFQRFQQWLLMLLRALAIMLLVLAFARPFIGQSLSRWMDASPRSIALVMDVSMSMAYENTLSEAKQTAKSILSQLRPGDEAALILFSDKTERVHALTEDLNEIETIIDGIESAGFTATRYFPALRIADEVLAESRYADKAVYLISDFQATGMRDFDNSWKLKPGVDFVAQNVGREKTENLAVTGVKAPAYWRQGTAEEDVFVRVRSFGTARQASTEVVVSVNGEEQVRKPVDMKDQSEVVINISIRFAEEGSHLGKVSVADRGFAVDNDYYFTVDVLPKIRVLIVNGESSRNWYDDEAHWFGLAVSSDKQSPFAVTKLETNAVSAAQLREHDVVVLMNVGNLSNGQAEQLTNFVNEGGSVLIAPGDRLQAASFNRQLAAMAPATLINQLTARDEYLLIADIESRHPILRPLEMDWDVRFESSWQLKPANDADVLMKFDNGNPALVERDLGAGRVLMLASALDLEWNNMPLKSMYLPFAHEMLKYLARTPEKKPSYVVGEKIEVLDALAPEARLIDPSGNTRSLGEGESGFTLEQPGVYRNVMGENQMYYAVNSPIEESDFSPIATSDVLDQVLNPETTPTQSSEVRAQLLREELEKPQRLWWWLLAVVALLLISESLIANRTHR